MQDLTPFGSISLGYSNGTTTSYQYDNASRLTSITYNGSNGVNEALSYSYDAAKNVLSLNRASGIATLVPDAITSATYDAANQQTQMSGTALQYDANGNLTSDGVNTYQWDARNQLVGIAGGSVASFVYDGLGRRIQKSINGQVTKFIYDGKDLVQEIANGTVGARYLKGLKVDERFVRQSDVLEFYHSDAIGSTIHLSNTAGTVATSYSYEPFGRASVTGVSANPFLFTGREIDGTGLYFFRTRYLSPSRHRFLSQDPTGLLGGVNLYSYVLNGPTVFTDPFGRDVFCSYEQASGKLFCTCDGQVIVDTTAYSGYGPGLNDPYFQDVPDFGPIPLGEWEIGKMRNTKHLKNALPLTPVPGQNDIFNTTRDPLSFFIHGPHANDNQDSSNGCIVTNKTDRDNIEKCGGPKTLTAY